MTARATAPFTGRPRTFDDDQPIVTKTDPAGRIAYANVTFRNIPGFAEAELLGQPHSMVRDPDMARVLFKLLWNRVQAGREIFAFVGKREKNGDHYRVVPHVTPTSTPRAGRSASVPSAGPRRTGR